MTHSLLRSLIRETLLLEEVYGAQAIVYHGTRADPQVLISALLNDELVPGRGAGFMYGKGLYTVYNFKGSRTEKGDYGDHVIKLKLNLYGYIIFDPEIALKVYKAPLSIAEQAQELGLSKEVINLLKATPVNKFRYATSAAASSASKFLKGIVKGLVFTGENDGHVAVVYDPTTAVPIAWKNVLNKSWTKVNRERLKPSLRRSASGGWQEEKYEDSSLKVLRRLKTVPPEERIVNGSLELNSKSITSLPEGLKVKESLVLAGTMITFLPEGLEVGGFLDLTDTPIKSLPKGLKVGGNLYLSNTQIQSIPEDAKIAGTLDLSNTFVTSLPAGLKLQSLDISNTPITSLPERLDIGWRLNLKGTKITSLPEDLKVKHEIEVSWGNRPKAPEHLQSKLRSST